MTIVELDIPGVFEIRLNPKYDSRGFFMRTYELDFFKKLNLHREWVNENHSKTLSKFTIRGLHFQTGDFSETKLVRCIRGSVFDVAVDVRPQSNSFGTWVGIELSENLNNMLFIPRGFAHGFCTMEENTEILYKVDNSYSPQHEIGIIWNDDTLKINWPLKDKPVLSEKDSKNITFEKYKSSLNI